MWEPVGVAMIGTGRWAEWLAQMIARTEALSLVTCFSRNEKNRTAFAETYGCRAAPTLQAAIEDPEVEGVLLVSPNSVHREQACLAAQMGKHVYCEKPIADTMEDGFAMKEACEQAGVVLLVGHCFRRLGAARKAKDLIDSGRIGKIVLAEANFSVKSGGVTPGSWKYHRETFPGGTLLQLGIHHADTLQYLLGSVVRVQGSLDRLVTEAEIDDVGIALLEFESGARGVISSSYVSPKMYYIRIYGTEGTLDYTTDMSIWPDPDRIEQVTALTIQSSKGEEKIAFEPRQMLIEELEEFAQCVRGEAQPETGAREALAALQIIRGAIKSSEQGVSVSLEAL
jgi:UDP-N-acetyl-2-amino-2-deoxyglucuronate dehydrogenase